MKYIIKKLIEFINGNPHCDSGNKAEINRRIREVTGRNPNECRALMVVSR